MFAAAKEAHHSTQARTAHLARLMMCSSVLRGRSEREESRTMTAANANAPTATLAFPPRSTDCRTNGRTDGRAGTSVKALKVVRSADVMSVFSYCTAVSSSSSTRWPVDQ